MIWHIHREKWDYTARVTVYSHVCAISHSLERESEIKVWYFVDELLLIII